MAKLKESECETILKMAGGVLGDKGFITTPICKPMDRELYIREHDYNNQISSHRAPVERAVAILKTWRILFTDYRRPLKTFLSSFRAAIGLVTSGAARPSPRLRRRHRRRCGCPRRGSFGLREMA
jgi:hypothetical protein